MSESTPARPPQVTAAGWMVIAGSVVVVLMAFSQVADLRSLQTRDAVEDYLASPPGDALGMGVQGVLQVLRIAAMVAAACAAATAILGWQVLQRSKGARVALSVLAVPLLLTGLISGGIVSAIVVAATVMLWFQPARDWFEGRAPAPAPRPLPQAFARDVPHDPLLDLPPPTAPPLHPTPYAAGASAAGASAADPSARPGAVRWACVLTWAFAGLAFSVLALVLLVTLAQPEAFFDEVRRNPDFADQGLSDGELTTLLSITSVVVMAWSVVALVLAVLTWRRVRWAAIGLCVCAGGAGLLCLVMLVGSAVMVVPLAACSATLSLLLRPEARRWWAARTTENGAR